MDDRVSEVMGLGGTAALDADGTLWADDVGESFLRALEAEGLVQLGSFARYEALLAQDPAAAFGMAVTCMAGLREIEVDRLASAFFFAHFARRVFPAMRDLVGKLKLAGARLAIVSASNRWVVAAGARVLGIERFAGIDVEIEGGRLTDRLRSPLSTGPGKVLRARELLGERPALAAGNGENDLPLLESAALQLVVAPAGIRTSLRERALARNWPVLEVEHPCPDDPLP